jgi:hypothetical protein
MAIVEALGSVGIVVICFVRHCLEELISSAGLDTYRSAETQSQGGGLDSLRFNAEYRRMRGQRK